jgi:hypothetical protein
VPTDRRALLCPHNMPTTSPWRNRRAETQLEPAVGCHGSPAGARSMPSRRSLYRATFVTARLTPNAVPSTAQALLAARCCDWLRMAPPGPPHGPDRFGAQRGFGQINGPHSGAGAGGIPASSGPPDPPAGSPPSASKRKIANHALQTRQSRPCCPPVRPGSGHTQSPSVEAPSRGVPTWPAARPRAVSLWRGGLRCRARTSPQI